MATMVELTCKETEEFNPADFTGYEWAAKEQRALKGAGLRPVVRIDNGAWLTIEAPVDGAIEWIDAEQWWWIITEVDQDRQREIYARFTDESSEAKYGSRR